MANNAMDFIRKATTIARQRAKQPVKAAATVARTAVRARIPVQVRHTGHRIVEGFSNAYAYAAAHLEGVEAMRGNRIAALQTATPATPIQPGQSTGTLTVQIKEGRYIRSFHGTAADELNFLCSSFKVNGFDVVDGNPINLANFQSVLQHIDRFGPLTGRRWLSAVNIEAAFVNISGGPAIFHGINIMLTDNECSPAGKKAAPAPGFYSFRSVIGKIDGLLRFRKRGG